MKITVLNGSPKGDISVTMQYVRYIQKHYPQHDIVIHNITQNIKKLETNQEAFDEVMESVRQSEVIFWAFPLYVFLVHGSYVRFIELIWERGAMEAFNGKYAAIIATSIHFFDHTAINYINGICDDLNMEYTGFFSAAMHDLLDPKHQKELLQFADRVFGSAEQKESFSKNYAAIEHSAIPYTHNVPKNALDLQGKKMMIVTDYYREGSNLTQMIDGFRNQFTEKPELIVLSQLKINGGCLGCIRCGYDNKCIYEGKDDVISTYEHLRTADIIVFAGTLEKRYFSALWKTFTDRRFYKTHQPLFKGKQFGYILSGPYSQLGYLKDILQAGAELNQVHFVGTVTDESKELQQIDRQLTTLGKQLISGVLQNVTKPSTFLGIGGNKIFRDEIWGRLSFIFRGDHLYYKANGFYDFPQKNWKDRWTTFLMRGLFAVPSIRSKAQQNMINQMVSPFKKIFEK